MTPEELQAALHAAADRVGTEAYTPPMDLLAEAGAQFLATSNFTDEHGTPVDWKPGMALGYGIMLGWLACEAHQREAVRTALDLLGAVDSSGRPVAGLIDKAMAKGL